MNLVRVGGNLVNPEYVTRIRADAQHAGVTIYMVDGTNIWLSYPTTVMGPEQWFNKIVLDLTA